MKECVICSKSHSGAGQTCSRGCRSAWIAQRQGKPSRFRTCDVCGSNYRATYSKQRTCGRECGRKLPEYEAALLVNGARLRQIAAERRKSWPSSKVFFGQCPECDKWFCARNSRGRYCSKECRDSEMRRRARAKWNATPVAERRRQVHPRKPRLTIECAQCFKDFTGTEGRRFCSPRCSARFHNGFSDHIRRAKHYGVPFERGITLDALIERDDGTCGLCGDPVIERWPDRMAASIDHVIPMSKGGSHTWGNVQLAHWLCNALKGADADVDFRLEDESCQQLQSSTRPVATAA